MSRRLSSWLRTALLLFGALLCGLILIEPFLNLPAFWDQLDVGLTLTGYGVLLLLGVFVADRRLWPRKWRLSWKPTSRLQFVQRFVAVVWGTNENSHSGK